MKQIPIIIDAPTARLLVLLCAGGCLAASAACGLWYRSNPARAIGIALGIAAPLILGIGLALTSGLY